MLCSTVMGESRSGRATSFSSLLTTTLLFSLAAPLSSFSWTPSSTVLKNTMKGGDNSLTTNPAHDYNERRWEALITHCLGNWSGSIGWYHPEESTTAEETSRTLNMRMSFQRRKDDGDVADWIVYHARSLGSKDHVVIEKYPAPDGEQRQTFYCFEDGIVGRTGRNIYTFPVVEHGFWADGMRRTVVLVWKNQRLARICYLQQQKQRIDCDDFDVSATNMDDIAVLPNVQPRVMSLEERKELSEKWASSNILDKVSVMDGDGKNPCTTKKEDAGDALSRLLGPLEDDENVLRVYLPNGVFVACPKSLAAMTAPFDIVLGYQLPKCGQIQILELKFAENGELQVNRASWYKSKD